MDHPTAVSLRPLPPVGSFINEIAARYRQRAPLLLALSLLIALPQMMMPIMTLLPAQEWRTVLEVALWAPYVVLIIWGSVALLTAVAQPQRVSTVRSALVVSGSYIVNSITTSILVVLIVAAGFILLVVPGIYFGIVYCLAAYLVVREGRANADALKRSKALIRGRWWVVFGRFIVLFLIVGLISLVLGFFFGAIFTTLPDSLQKFFGDELEAVVQWLFGPVNTLALAVLYDHLLAAGGTAPITA